MKLKEIKIKKVALGISTLNIGDIKIATLYFESSKYSRNFNQYQLRIHLPEYNYKFWWVDKPEDSIQIVEEEYQKYLLEILI